MRKWAVECCMYGVKEFFGDRKTFLAAGFLGCMVLWVLLLYTQHRISMTRISETKASGLASVAGGFDPLGQWIYRDQIAATKANQRLRTATLTFNEEEDLPGRKIVRKAALRLRVNDVETFLGVGSDVARQLGGYVVNSDLAHGGPSAIGTLVVAVPASRFDQALDRLRASAASVEDVKTEAADVTKRYVDFEATLRSYRAEEAQYLSILRQAQKVQDVMLVTEKLLKVRERIEKAEGEFRYLQHEVEMSSISAEVYVEGPARPAHIWQPSASVQHGWQSMQRGLASFADVVIQLVFVVPVLLLWIAGLWSVAAGGWRMFRWTKRHWAIGAREQQP